LTYFRATFLEGEEQAAEMFLAEYGPEPREINVVLPFDTVDENLEAWNEAYVASALLHRCNGKKVIRAIDPDSGEVLVENGRSVETGEPVECDGKPITYWTDKKGKDHPVYCEPHGRLRIIIPELRRLAFVTVLTTSTWDVLNLSTQLEAIRDMNKGSLRGVPLVLKRRPYWKSTPSGSDGRRARRKMWLLSVEADPAWVDAQLTAMRTATLPNGKATLQLPPGVPDTNGTNGEEIEGEIEELPFTDDSEELAQEDEHVYEAGMPDEVRNMNEFYKVAQERFGYDSKKAVVAALTGFLGKTVLKAQREDGMEMPDLWGILEEIEEADRQPLGDPDDLDEFPF